MQGAWITSLDQEDSTCQGARLQVLQLLKPMCSGAHELQLLSPHTLLQDGAGLFTTTLISAHNFFFCSSEFTSLQTQSFLNYIFVVQDLCAFQQGSFSTFRPTILPKRTPTMRPLLLNWSSVLHRIWSESNQDVSRGLIYLS